MKSVFLAVILFSIYGIAQSVAPASPPPSGISAWIQSQGGFIASVTLVIGLLNILLSFLAQVFAKLSAAEPAWLQSLGSVLLSLTQWLSANTPTPKDSVPPKV